jgi:dipeptide/tripeptide permease
VFDVLGEVNWLAVLLATVAYYVLGALWFTPLFGRVWDRAVGYDRPRGQRFGPLYYVAPLVGSAIATIATAVLVAALGIEQLSDAIVLGLLVGIGYAVAVSLTNAVTPTTPRPLLLAAVDGGYHVVGLVLVSVLLVALP